MSSKLIWTDERISSLISYYRAEPALWSTQHPSYHNLTARNVAFHRIAEFMGRDITPDMVKTKFETLRGQYTRELLKIKNSKASDSGPDEEYRVRWKFFDQLHFLKNVVSPKTPISNSQPSPPATLKSQQIEEDSERSNSPSTGTLPSRSGSPGMSYDQSAACCDTHEPPSVQPPPKKRRKGENMLMVAATRMNQAMAAMLQNIHEEARTTPLRGPSKSDNDAEADSLFCRQLALKMKEVTNYDLKIEMQFRMQKLLLDTIRVQNSRRDGMLRPSERVES